MARNKEAKNNVIQMKTTVDSLTGMIMAVETADGIIDLRPFGATCDRSNYQGMVWDFD